MQAAGASGHGRRDRAEGRRCPGAGRGGMACRCRSRGPRAVIRCGALPSLPAAPIPLRAIALARQGAQAIAGQAGAGQAGAMQATKRQRRPDRPSPAFGQRRGARCGARHVVRKAAPPRPSATDHTAGRGDSCRRPVGGHVAALAHGPRRGAGSQNVARHRPGGLRHRRPATRPGHPLRAAAMPDRRRISAGRPMDSRRTSRVWRASRRGTLAGSADAIGRPELRVHHRHRLRGIGAG